MKILGLRLAASVVTLLCIAYLSGCSGFEGTRLPDASTNPEAVAVGNISGNVFGGHAPLVGAHVYLLQASTAGYGAPATTLLTSSSTATQKTYPVVANVNDPIIPTGSYYHESTDSTGSFNLSGDYTCTTGPGGTPGPPVYIYAFGGAPTYPSTSNVFAGSSLTVSNVAGANFGETATYTFTTTTTELFYEGEVISLGNFTSSTGSNSTNFLLGLYVNGASGTVLSTNLSTTTFAVTLPDDFGLFAAGTYLVSGPITAMPTFNPGVVNVALLGNCPSTGNFANTVHYVYMNEVSTVAAAYALAGFASATPANVNFLNIGTSSTNLTGIENAALTANQLYDIEGSNVGTNQAGEGHIARIATPVGTGTVPQSLLDSLGNTIAACVDSQNTYNYSTNVGAVSAQCNTLFTTATADGTTTGAQPLDTGTAALNIARNPYSAVTNYSSTLFNLATGNVPFTPHLGSAPHDYTVELTYTGGGMAPSVGGAPLSVAVDVFGNIYAATNNSTIAAFSPLGVPVASGGFSGNNLNQPSSLAVDPTSTFVLATNPTQVSRFSTAGVAGTDATVGTALQGVAFDSAGNAWITDSGTTNHLYEINPSTGATLFTATGNGLSTPEGLAIEPAKIGNTTLGTIWVPNTGNNDLSGFTSTGAGSSGSPFTTRPSFGAAIDAAGNVWTSSVSGALGENSRTGATVYGSPITTSAPIGTTTTPGIDGIAIDGNSNVWAASPTGASIYKFNNAGAELSGTAGYNANTASRPDGLALDGSGNVWFNTLNDSALHELVGAAVPVVTPLALGVKSATQGSKP